MKTLNSFLVISLFLIHPSTFAASSPVSEQEAIKSMKGCYEVTFHFVETFVNDPNYSIRSKEYLEHGLEWVELDADSGDEIELQHILVTPEGVQKHWRQEWTYQPATLEEFKGNLMWKQRELDPAQVKGLWAQRVFQVDDSPRYECAAPWVQWFTSNGEFKNYWECETFAPLPRREFTQRSDYQILNRTNRHEIVSGGWLHHQDNGKLKFANATDRTSPLEQVASEKGLDTYLRVDDARCSSAKEWWNKNKGVWHEIQAMWKHIQGHHKTIEFKAKVDDKTLWMRLFEFTEMAETSSMDGTAIQKRAHDIIHEFMLETPESK